ncbi:hypothetical protein GCM10028773_58590 [Spirosoma koreense]
MSIEGHTFIPALTREDVEYYVATHEFNEIGNQHWFRLVPHGADLFRTPEYGLFSGTELTVGDILWIASGLSSGYQARLLTDDSISALSLAAMHQ